MNMKVDLINRDKFLNEIFTVSLSKYKDSNDNSLYSGKSGLLIFYYLYSKYKGDRWILEIAEELLENICSTFHLNTSLSFKYGFPGIGYTFMYLFKNGFLENELEEILDDVDKYIFERRGHRLELIKDGIESSGYYFYFLERYKLSVMKNDSRNKNYLKHILIYLIDEIENMIKNICLNTSTELSILYFLIEIEPYKINEAKVRECIIILNKQKKISLSQKSKVNNEVLYNHMEEVLLFGQLNHPTCYDIACWSLFFHDYLMLKKTEVLNQISYDVDLSNKGISLERGLSGLGISILNQRK